MTDYLSAATEAAGVPEALIRRAAEARAAADGLSVDDILAAWAGGTAAPAAAPSPEPPPATETPALPIEETTPAVVPVESPQLTPAPEAVTQHPQVSMEPGAIQKLRTQKKTCLHMRPFCRDAAMNVRPGISIRPV